MHARQLVDLAATLATDADTIVHGTRTIVDESLEQYWVSTKCRLQRWQFALKQFENDLRRQPDSGDWIWPRLEPIVTEVILAEVLTRFWAAALHAIEEVCPVRNSACIGRSALIGHLEARNRVLRLIMLGRSQDAPQVESINETRSKAERWTDLLLSYLHRHVDVAGFGFDSNRVQDFTDDLTSESKTRCQDMLQGLLLTSIRTAFSHDGLPYSANYDLNRSVAGAVLSTLGPEIYTYSGKIVPAWQTRLMLTTAEARTVLQSVLQESDQDLSHRRF